MSRRVSLRALFLAIPLVAAVALSTSVLLTFAGRLTHPYDLEWMEGGMLVHAWRIQQGLPLYIEPNSEFIPMIYPPAYPSLVAGLGSILGLSHMVGRLVSVAGTLAAGLAIVYGTRRHGGSTLVGFLAASVFLGTYPENGAFFDLVRPDAMSMGLLAWAIVMALERTPRGPVIAGLLLAAAFATKHNAAAFGFPIAFGLWVRSGWREALRFGLAALVPAVVFTTIITLTSQGRFLEYLLAVPRSHPMVVDRAIPGSLTELSQALPVALLAIGVWIVARGPSWAPKIPSPVMAAVPTSAAVLVAWGMSYLPVVRGIANPTGIDKAIAFGFVGATVTSGALVLLGGLLSGRFPWRWFYAAAVGGGALMTGALMRGHHGGFLNVFIPLHWVICFGFGIVACEMHNRLRPTAGAALIGAVFSAQIGIQIADFDPQQYLPTAEDRAAGDELVAELAQYEGPVLSPFSPWLAVQAGHEPSFHLIALWDIRHPTGPFRPHVKEVSEAVRTHEYAVIVDGSETMGYGVQKYYKVDQDVMPSGKAMMPKTGWRRRVKSLMVPK